MRNGMVMRSVLCPAQWILTTFSLACTSRIFRRASTWMCELTCFRVLVLPVRNLMQRAISSLRPRENEIAISERNHINTNIYLSNNKKKNDFKMKSTRANILHNTHFRRCSPHLIKNRDISLRKFSNHKHVQFTVSSLPSPRNATTNSLFSFSSICTLLHFPATSGKAHRYWVKEFFFLSFIDQVSRQVP